MAILRLSRWISCVWTSFGVLSFFLNNVSTLSGNVNSCNTIEAAFHARGMDKTYFLSKGEYIEYNLYRESEAKVGPITELGLDARSSHPDAAFTFANDTLLIIKGCRYFKYAPVDDGHWTLQDEGENSNGLPCSPDAAVTSLTGNITVFKGCQVWTFSNETQTFSLTGLLSEIDVPCDLNAAAQWDSSEIIFIKGVSFWKFHDEFGLSRPFHTDDLNLCSWYLCGEADWMRARNRGRFPCNGDRRFCGLRLNQVTMPGLHNAGSGFDGGFWYDCLMRNHARNIEEQLELGIRYLDIDPSYYICGVLGSHHSFFCGGSICRMLKQTRAFLSRNPHEVIVLTFNHEMQDAEIVIPALTRQLTNQLRPMLNRGFRSQRMSRWPKLRWAVRTNKRVFVFYAPEVRDEPFRSQEFRQNRWIHTESWMGSTWTEFNLNGGNCSQIVDRTAQRCYYHQLKQLVEVSIVPTASFSTCIDYLAGQCRPFHHLALRACETYRFRHGRSPNVLLVDYPEVQPDDPNSVFQAVYHQNVRNVLAHRQSQCQVRVDAAVRRPSTNGQVLFFVESNVIIYSSSSRTQIQKIAIPGVSSVDAAHVSVEGDIVVIKDCETISLDSSSLSPLATNWTAIPGCQSAPDATAMWNDTLHVFQGCYVTAQGQEPFSLTQLGLPCDVDAALTRDGEFSVFKGNYFWVRRAAGETAFTFQGLTLDWTIDAVVC